MHTLFHRFTQLPCELRDLIWEHTLPEPRVLDMYPASTSQETPAQQGLRFTTQLNEPPPTLSAVCQESRSFIMRHYSPLTLGPTTKYVDLSRDILLLDSCLLERGLLRALSFMGKVPQIRDNLRSIAFGTSWGAPSGIEHPILGRKKPGRGNTRRFLQRLAVFHNLQRVIFVLYQEVQFEVRELPRAAGAWDGHLNQNATLYLSGTEPPPVKAILPQNALADPSCSPPAVVVHGRSRPALRTVPWSDDKPPLPHVNELLYYPLDLGEETDHMQVSGDNCPDWYSSVWPMTEDFRYFKRDLRRAIDTSVVYSPVDGPGDAGRRGKRRRKLHSWDGEERGHATGKRWRRSVTTATGSRVPLMVGASLLWRFALPAPDSLEHVLDGPLQGRDACKRNP